MLSYTMYSKVKFLTNTGDNMYMLEIWYITQSNVPKLLFHPITVFVSTQKLTPANYLDILDSFKGIRFDFYLLQYYYISRFVFTILRLKNKNNLIFVRNGSSYPFYIRFYRINRDEVAKKLIIASRYFSMIFGTFECKFIITLNILVASSSIDIVPILENTGLYLKLLKIFSKVCESYLDVVDKYINILDDSEFGNMIEQFFNKVNKLLTKTSDIIKKIFKMMVECKYDEDKLVMVLDDIITVLSGLDYSNIDSVFSEVEDIDKWVNGYVKVLTELNK